MPKVDLPKNYDPSSVEDRLYTEWEASGAFNPDTLPERNQAGAPYSIMMPPPNVTGVLHLGHALENSLMDTLVRFQRMRGRRAMLLPGTDHAAISTQAKVEKMLMKEGVQHPREALGREKLVEKIRAFAEESKSTIISQVRKIGTTCDWSRLAYTFDTERNRAVNELFIRMYADGLIYRGYRVVNWSVMGQSTCSDDEVIHVERPTKLYTFNYGKEFPITIATTRPETKLGDTAVAVHPTDERYRAYIGKTFTVDVGAASSLEIRVIADESVDPAFGTGALGVTPAHSAVDFAMYEKQKAAGTPINIIPVIGQDGRMTEAAGKGYVGLTAEEAREKFVAWLRAEGLLVKEEEIVQNVGTSERYGDVLEAIPMTQWWLDVNKVIPSRGVSLKDLLRQAVTTGLQNNPDQKVTITPERFTKLYLDRIEQLRDWCLSRQIWWGHRIPAWYKGDEIRVASTSPGDGWEQDPDTLDTWFSSGSWTFSTLGWPLTRVIFVRHGEAQSNAKNMLDDGTTGIQNDLTEKGIAQVEATAEKLKGAGATVIIASPMLRAKHTEAILAEKLGLEILYDERLHELGLGKFNGKTAEEFFAARGSFEEWVNGKTAETVESYKSIESRAFAFMQDLLKTHAGKTIIVVSHGETIATMSAYGTGKASTGYYPDNAGSLERNYGSDGRLNTDLQTFHPTQWMTMAYEILYLWMMRMILMSTYALQEIPFKNAYIHGILRDEHGKKFSKSAGNGIDPLEVIEKYGCDALRYSAISGNTPGNDSRFSLEKVEGARNLVNKLWNISRYILSQVDVGAHGHAPEVQTLSDRWILSRLNEVVASVTQKLETYQFSAAGEELREFTWNDFADWYLEIAKIEKEKDAILVYILKTLLALWHPFMPFVTEEIWKTAGFGGMLIVAEWPTVGAHGHAPTPEFNVVRSLISDMRRLRAEQGIEAAKMVEFVLVAPKDVQALVTENMAVVQMLTRASMVTCVAVVEQGWATTLSGSTTIGLNLAGAVDTEKERAKMEKKIAETEAYITSLGAKMKNQEFLEKAPTKVKEEMDRKYDEAHAKLAALKERIQSLRSQ